MLADGVAHEITRGQQTCHGSYLGGKLCWRIVPGSTWLFARSCKTFTQRCAVVQASCFVLYCAAVCCAVLCAVQVVWGAGTGQLPEVPDGVACRIVTLDQVNSG